LEPTLESLTDQIKELAKNQGMKCDVVLQKKNEVEVFDFEVIPSNMTNSIYIRARIRNSDWHEMISKEDEIIKAIKTILEN